MGKEEVWVHSYMIKSMRPILQSKATQEQRAEMNMYMHMFISATYCTYLRKRELSSGVVDLLCLVSITDRSCMCTVHIVADEAWYWLKCCGSRFIEVHVQ